MSKEIELISNGINIQMTCNYFVQISLRRNFRTLFKVWSINSLLISVEVREVSKSLCTFLLVTGIQA